MNAESTRNLDEILSTEQLEGFQSRAAGYDANNEFFQEDFDEMKASGYLIQAVPEELGGLGFSLSEVCQQLFAKATELCDKSAPNMWQAHIMFRHAQVFKRHNSSGGRARFAELVDQAQTTAKFMGMASLLTKLEKLEGDGTTKNGDQDSDLTPRELEVLQLIAQGKSNKLIASELNRSLATIATHVRAILNKTHTANRTEAAAFAFDHKLFQAD
jgi:DNA-binding CsgD family transcriptional regulator